MKEFFKGDLVFAGTNDLAIYISPAPLALTAGRPRNSPPEHFHNIFSLRTLSLRLVEEADFYGVTQAKGPHRLALKTRNIYEELFDLGLELPEELAATLVDLCPGCASAECRAPGRCGV